MSLVAALDLARYRVTGWALAFFVSAALNLGLVLVIMTGRGSAAPAPRRAFALDAALGSLLLLFVGGRYAAGDAAQSVAVVRLALGTLAIVGPATLTFLCLLVGAVDRLGRVRALAWAAGVALAGTTLATPLVVSDAAGHDGLAWAPRAGPLLPALLVELGLCLALALGMCARRARKSSDPVERDQLRWVLAAYGIGVLAGLDLLPAWGVRLYPTSFVWLTASELVLVYAMRHHELLDAPDLGWRALAWISTSAVVAVPVALFLLATAGWSGWRSPLLATLALGGLLLLLRAHFAVLQPRIDDVFLRRRRDLERELEALAEQLLVVHTAEAIARETADLLSRTLYVKLVAFAVREAAWSGPGADVPAAPPGERGGGATWRVVASSWGSVPPPADDDPFLGFLAERGELVRAAQSWLPEHMGIGVAAERLMTRWGAAAVVPVMLTEGEPGLAGLLAVGPRPDGAAFATLELELLRRLGLAVARPLAAARLYDRRQRLRRELEAKVAARREDLARALVALDAAQGQLVQREKLATLGVVVGGVATELEVAIDTVGRAVPELRRGVTACEHAVSACLAALPRGPAGDEVRRFAEDVRIDFMRHDVGPLVEAIAEGARRARAIAGDLRHFARPSEHSRVPADLHREIEAALALVSGELGDRIRVERDLAPDLPPVECDPGPLGQVFANLLINAVQAIAGAGTIRVATRAVDGGERVEVSVRDDGCGIAPEHLGRIFEPFFTTKGMGASGGMGLGLSISYGIVQQHGGSIAVASEPGRGTEFRVVLPVKASAGLAVTG
jgi:signal transduction histidine kinase